MGTQPALLEEVEVLISSTEIGRRAEALRRVTDLFASGSAVFSDDQREVFDDVMSRLVSEIDTSARAAFGRRIVTIPGAPSHVLRALALDDEISVAEPVLSGAEQLDDEVLLEGARTKSQEHLLAISRRSTLVEAVTDVLVERGNKQVALSTAQNPGAKFSEFGYSTLVQRSETDGDLALRVWQRAELPRQFMLKIFAQASETVRAELEAADRGKASLFRNMVAKASDQLQTEARQRSPEYAAAEAHVRALHRAGELNESQLWAFASAGKFDETTIALSIMCDLPIGLIERATTQSLSEQILVLAKAIGLSWDTTKAILRLQGAKKPNSAHEIETLCSQFTQMKPATATKAMQFYRLLERAGAPRPS